MKLGLHNLMQVAHQTAIDKGWWENDQRSLGELIALMHSELSEALEEWRVHGLEQSHFIYVTDPTLGYIPIHQGDHITDDAKPEGIAVEFADVLIRIFDTCAHYNIPLDHALMLKMNYNQTRPYRHGGKLA